MNLTAETVGELRAALAELPDDMPICTHWEGTTFDGGCGVRVGEHYSHQQPVCVIAT